MKSTPGSLLMLSFTLCKMPSQIQKEVTKMHDPSSTCHNKMTGYLNVLLPDYANVLQIKEVATEKCPYNMDISKLKVYWHEVIFHFCIWNKTKI